MSAADRALLAAIIADRNRAQKHVWRAQVVLLSADRVGTGEIMRRTGLSKPSVWRWQERYLETGVDGLLRDKTRPSRVPALAEAKEQRPVQFHAVSLTRMRTTGIAKEPDGRLPVLGSGSEL